MTQIDDVLRRETIKRSHDAYNDDGNPLKKTLEIEFRGQKKVLPVLNLHPNVLLLNHNNNRLSAQLTDHPEKGVVYGNPISDKAQSILANLLKNTPDYQALKDQLDQLGQQHPGLITRGGLLVNGNTRVVALRELGRSGVDVALLPEDVDDEVILDLEMFLQMVHLTHQDYTFTNELLLIEKCRKLGNTDKQIAEKMKWVKGWKKKIDEKFQLLALINEIRSLSSTPLNYEIFDTKSQHLKDLNEQYQILRQNDLFAANQMKYSRIAAMFLGVNKDQTRAINDDFINENVARNLDNQNPAKVLLDGITRVKPNDGLDDILGDSAEPEVVDAKELVKNIIRQRIDDKGFISNDLNPALEELKKNIILASEEIISKNKRISIMATPADELRVIREGLEDVVQLFSQVSSQRGFDAEKFGYELGKAEESLAELVKLFRNSSRH